MLIRHEQAAASMAGRYGQVTGRAAVGTATLGPGTINMQLGVADATTNYTPMVAMFAPVTRWSDAVPTAQAIPEMFRNLASWPKPNAPPRSTWRSRTRAVASVPWLSEAPRPGNYVDD
jgi:thiamine pyrophosphate-dependent acetolactate synthase large subunit-like protein